MSTLDIAALGFTQDELQERVVKRICDELLHGVTNGADEADYGSTTLLNKLEGMVREQVDASIAALAEKHVLPNVASYIENLTLQVTNKWGEAKGEPVTFIEYLVERAEHYLTEKVNYKGESKGEDRYGSGWTPHQTRIAHLVHEHLHYSIKTAMEKALQTANSAITEGIYETVKIKLAEFAADLDVTVKTKAKR